MLPSGKVRHPTTVCYACAPGLLGGLRVELELKPS